MCERAKEIESQTNIDVKGKKMGDTERHRQRERERETGRKREGEREREEEERKRDVQHDKSFVNGEVGTLHMFFEKHRIYR